MAAATATAVVAVAVAVAAAAQMEAEELAFMDPAYEFCAPQYVDFATVDMNEDDGADAWFDAAGLAGGNDGLRTPEHSPTKQKRQTRSQTKALCTEGRGEMHAVKQPPLKKVLVSHNNKENQKGTKRSLNVKQAQIKFATEPKPKKPCIKATPEKMKDRPAVRALLQSTNNNKSAVAVSGKARFAPLLDDIPAKTATHTLKRSHSEMHSTGAVSLTVPKTPKLHTASRIRAHDCPAAEAPDAHTKTHAKAACERPARQANTKNQGADEEHVSHKETIARAFKLATQERARCHAMVTRSQETTPTRSPYDSIALKVQKFQTKTPARFHTRPHSQDKPVVQRYSLRLTRAVEPQFATASRIRHTTVKSTAELEEEELAKMPRFKALPLNPKVLQSGGEIGVPRVMKRPLTEPQGFHFMTEDRALLHPFPIQEEDNMHKKQTRSQALQLGKATVPLSPMLATTVRALSRPSLQLPVPEAEPCTFKARPAPPPAPPQPVHTHHAPHVIEQNPFNLATEERGKKKQEELRQRLLQKQAEDAAARAVHAQPLPPTLESPWMPNNPVMRKELTLPAPFELRTNQRGSLTQARVTELRMEWEQRIKESAKFTAQPNRSLTVDPFVPMKSTKPLTDAYTPPLASTQRATQRQEFDALVAEKLSEAEWLQHEQELLKQQLEEEAIRDLRKQLIPKANPVPDFDHVFQPRRSTRPLTVAKSPVWTQRERNVKHKTPSHMR